MKQQKKKKDGKEQILYSQLDMLVFLHFPIVNPLAEGDEHTYR